MTGIILSADEEAMIKRSAESSVAGVRERVTECWPLLAKKLAESEPFYRILQEEIEASMKDLMRDR